MKAWVLKTIWGQAVHLSKTMQWTSIAVSSPQIRAHFSTSATQEKGGAVPNLPSVTISDGLWLTSKTSVSRYHSGMAQGESTIGRKQVYIFFFTSSRVKYLPENVNELKANGLHFLFHSKELDNSSTTLTVGLVAWMCLNKEVGRWYLGHNYYAWKQVAALLYQTT